MLNNEHKFVSVAIEVFMQKTRMENYEILTLQDTYERLPFISQDYMFSLTEPHERLEKELDTFRELLTNGNTETYPRDLTPLSYIPTEHSPILVMIKGYFGCKLGGNIKDSNIYYPAMIPNPIMHHSSKEPMKTIINMSYDDFITNPITENNGLLNSLFSLLLFEKNLMEKTALTVYSRIRNSHNILLNHLDQPYLQDIKYNQCRDRLSNSTYFGLDIDGGYDFDIRYDNSHKHSAYDKKMLLRQNVNADTFDALTDFFLEVDRVLNIIKTLSVDKDGKKRISTNPLN